MQTQQRDLRKNYIGMVDDRVAEQRAVEPLVKSGRLVKEYFLTLMAALMKRPETRS